MNQEEPKTDEPKATTPSIEFQSPEGGVREIYSDWYLVNYLSRTVRIRFAQFIPDPRSTPSEGKWTIMERTAVSMPYHTAKYLRDTLDKIITTYEAENGEITTGKVPSVIW